MPPKNNSFVLGLGVYHAVDPGYSSLSLYFEGLSSCYDVHCVLSSGV